MHTPAHARARRCIRPLAFLLLLLVAAPARAQDPAAPGPTPITTVRGVVHDSIAGVPLVGATVQLASIENPAAFIRVADTDLRGRFRVDSVPPGRYMIGFLHPMLDSLGLDPPLRMVTIADTAEVTADLAIPAPAQLRLALCGPRTAGDSGALVLGAVRDAQARTGVGGVTVSLRWLELAVGRQGITAEDGHASATTQESGWFALCDVPRATPLALSVSRGGDTTMTLEVTVDGSGFLRRELYLGAPPVVVVEQADDDPASALPPRTVQTGEGRLAGTVVSSTGQPLRDAIVGIMDGPQARTNDSGEWSLAGLPTGSRMLEVRALGYYPERRMVDVIPGAPPVRIALATFRSVMDTVRVTASRLYDRDRTGFQGRRRSGAGHYVTPEDITRRRPVMTSDLLRTLPNIQLRHRAGGRMGNTILMRGTFAGTCSPGVYIDGMRLDGADTADIDSWVRPEELAGMEIYSVATVPAQYQTLNGCGAILLWTK